MIKIALVAAVASNDVIGRNNRLLWKISDDFRWFKNVTMNKPMVMGRKTFDSIGRALPGRDTLVLTRDPDFIAPGVFVVRSMRAALKLGAECAGGRGTDEVCIIGGGNIYAQTMDRADRIYLTRVDASPEGDVYFPTFDEARWVHESAGSAEKSAENEFACKFFILERRRGGAEKL